MNATIDLETNQGFSIDELCENIHRTWPSISEQAEKETPKFDELYQQVKAHDLPNFLAAMCLSSLASTLMHGMRRYRNTMIRSCYCSSGMGGLSATVLMPHQLKL